MSSFAAHHTGPLYLKTIPQNASVTAQGDHKESHLESALNSLLSSLKPPIDKSILRSALRSLEGYSDQFTVQSGQTPDVYILRRAILSRLLVGFYAETLDVCLKDAIEADTEAQWWGDIERSWRRLSWYSLQTMPLRIQRFVEAVVQYLRTRHIPVTLSAFSPSSLRKIFPKSTRPSILTTALFPHLAERSYSLFSSPMELIRHECTYHREELERLRDERAEVLGLLMNSRNFLKSRLGSTEDLDDAAVRLREIFGLNGLDLPHTDVFTSLNTLAFTEIPKRTTISADRLKSLRRPSRIVQIWPRLVFLPPATLIFIRLIYGSRQSLLELVHQSFETITGFWFGYVVEPVRNILDTVRTGGNEDTRIITMENVKADIESLERMAYALGKDKLLLSAAELEGLSIQIRKGDLTPVLKIYEDEIKSPVRSALTGSLIRSLLIQVQKAKVDLDQALAGIDKLLKSQELTFAFVGVAPSLAIVYAVFDYFRGIWKGGYGKTKYGGMRSRTSSWLAMRRIERLLVSSAREPQYQNTHFLSPRTSGLLLISVSQLRAFAEKQLPPRSHFREGFLEDIEDLENPDLGRQEKQNVIERMWRSWSYSLGWHNLAVPHSNS